MTIRLYFIMFWLVLSSMHVASASASLEHIEVVRYIDISTQLVNVHTQLRIINTVEDPISSYVYVVDPSWAENLSHIEVLDGKANQLEFENKLKEISGEKVLQYNILLSKPLYSGETADLEVNMIITNYLRSHPKSVKQYEKHSVLFLLNVYYHSMYFTHKQITYLYMGTTKAAVIDGEMYTVSNDSEYGFQYGPFNRIEPLKYSRSVFYYENKSPFLVVEKVKRFVKLSHWGYISVWDQIQLLHSGPKLAGPFERSIRDKHNTPQDTRIEKYVSTLPSYAFDIYLKDEIGLIWSFNVNYENPGGVDVSIQPRFVLYGGWRTDYEIGYSLPLRDYVTCHGNSDYMLSFPLLDKIFENMVVKEAEINIILPEGASFRAMEPDFAVDNTTDAKYCYYFDVMCREIITFKRYNLVEKHITNVSFAYKFSQFNMLVKPMIIAVYIYLIFILLKITTKPHFSPTLEKQVKPVQSIKLPVIPVMKKKTKKNVEKK